MKKIVFDSFAMIAFFEKETGAEIVAEHLYALIQKKQSGFMSVINWGEIYYNILREQGEKSAEKILDQMQKYPIEIIGADKSLTYEAAKLKGKFKIAYADCFAAALARTLQAPLLTGDPEFKKLTGLIKIQWIS
jgi:ribonuclease VapC